MKKQKIKTHKATAKRLKITGCGLVMRQKGSRSHLRRRKRPSVLRSLDKAFPVAPSHIKLVKRLLPYA